jgi:hypothetical protein
MDAMYNGANVENIPIQKLLNCLCWGIRVGCLFEIPSIVSGNTDNIDLVAGALFRKYAEILEE